SHKKSPAPSSERRLPVHYPGPIVACRRAGLSHLGGGREMRKLSLRISWRVLALLSVAMSPLAWMAGCGSDQAAIPAAHDGGGDGSDKTPPDTTGTPDGDVVVTGTRDPDASFACTAQGSSCTTSFACCTANCGAAADGGTECLGPNGFCKTPGLACTNG